MRRFLAPLLAAVALLAAAPAHAQSSVEQEFSHLHADQAHRLGVQQYQRRNYQAALRQFEKAVALAPDVAAYRRSVVLTRQRIAAMRANQKAVRDSLDRARRNLSSSDDDAPAGIANEFEDGPTTIGTDLEHPTTRVGSRAKRGSDTTTSDPSSDTPLDSDSGLRDAAKDLHLGGNSTDGAPTDLPVAGLPSADLPVGQMPPETMVPEPSVSSDDLPMASDGGAAKTSMFPFLDPLTDSLPPTSLPKQADPSVAAPGRAGAIRRAPPRLDMPQGPQ